MVVNEALVARLVSKVLQWICPQQVAHESVRRRLSEPVDLWHEIPQRASALQSSPNRRRERGEGPHGFKVLERVELWAETPVHAEELLVHDCSQRKVAERLHAGVVEVLRVLVLGCEASGSGYARSALELGGRQSDDSTHTRA